MYSKYVYINKLSNSLTLIPKQPYEINLSSLHDFIVEESEI